MHTRAYPNRVNADLHILLHFVCILIRHVIIVLNHIHESHFVEQQPLERGTKLLTTVVHNFSRSHETVTYEYIWFEPSE